MAVSKVILNGSTLIDLTADTAQNADVANPKTFHKADGTQGTGSISTVTAGTPTATKSAVSNHALTVTPSVTNPAGLITAGTINGTAVSVTASELASGNKSITANGDNIDVVGYSTVSVNVSGGGDDDYKNAIERTSWWSSKASITLPNGLTRIGKYVFYEAGMLSSIGTIPNTVTTIDEYAFYDCAWLDIDSLPNSITTIGRYAFYGCSDLSLTSLPNQLTRINAYSFQSCQELALTSLPPNLTQIDDYAFSGCANMTCSSLPSSITSIASSAFYGCTNVTFSSLPSGLTTIGSNAFYRCKNITISTIPIGVTSIPGGAFRSCINIETISSDAVLTSVGNNVFLGDTGYPMKLRELRFPNMSAISFGTVVGTSTSSGTNACFKLELADLGNASTIAANAFYGCNKLTTLILRNSSTACSLANVSAFTSTPMRGYNSQTGTVYVPQALISTYQTANNWSTLYNNGTITFAAIEGSQYEITT